MQLLNKSKEESLLRKLKIEQLEKLIENERKSNEKKISQMNEE